MHLLQFLEEKDVPVVGLREAVMLQIEEESATPLGTAPARLFGRGAAPVEVPPGVRLDEHLG